MFYNTIFTVFFDQVNGDFFSPPLQGMRLYDFKS